MSTARFLRREKAVFDSACMEFKEKFIAFVDILGFKSLVEASEAGTGKPLDDLLRLVDILGTGNERDKYERSGPICCPRSSYSQRNLDFRLTQISDCVIVSAEISPAGIINLIHHCSTAVLDLMIKGFMCRGYITRGNIYHTDRQVIGSGYQRAYSQEEKVSIFKREADERGTPFVEVDSVVSKYVEESLDKCVKEMFSRFVKSDDQAIALFPFQGLSHSFLVNGAMPFDPKRERRENQKVRLLLSNLRTGIMAHVDTSKSTALQKAEQYINAMDAQLAVCNETEHFIDELVSPILARTFEQSC